jgi:hypothetical protein
MTEQNAAGAQDHQSAILMDNERWISAIDKPGKLVSPPLFTLPSLSHVQYKFNITYLLNIMIKLNFDSNPPWPRL